MGAKSLPSAPSPCSQMMAASGCGAVSISMTSSSLLMVFFRSFLPHGRLGSECLDDFVVRLDVRAADQVDAIRHRGEDAGNDGLARRVLQAFERLADGLRLSRQVDDQRALADHGDLA